MNSQIGFIVAIVAAISGIAAAVFTVPEEYQDRMQMAAVVKEFRQMFDSVFGPINERPYREDVTSLLRSMDKFLMQSPELRAVLEPRELEEVNYYMRYFKQRTDQGMKYIRTLNSLTVDEIKDIYYRHAEWVKNGFVNLERNKGYYLAGLGKTAIEQFLEPALRDIGLPLRAIGQALSCPGPAPNNYGPPLMTKYGFAQNIVNEFAPTNCPACQMNKTPNYH